MSQQLTRSLNRLNHYEVYLLCYLCLQRLRGAATTKFQNFANCEAHVFKTRISNMRTLFDQASLCGSFCNEWTHLLWWSIIITDYSSNSWRILFIFGLTDALQLTTFTLFILHFDHCIALVSDAILETSKFEWKWFTL